MRNDDHDPDTNDSDQHRPKATRRDSLKAAAGGFGLLGFGGFLQTGTPGDDIVTIPIAKRGDEVAQTAEVPKQWRQQVKRARGVFDQVLDDHKNEPWFDYVGQGAAEETIGGLAKHVVRVYATDVEAAQDALPGEKNGIPISVRESRERVADGHLSSTCDEDSGGHSCVEGGTNLHNPTGDYCFSSTCIVKNSGSYYLMTSAHVHGSCGDNISGESVYSGDTSTKVGDVSTFNHDHDVSLIDQSGNINGLANTIRGRSEGVAGHMTESGCETLISNFDGVNHQGISTGLTSGYLDEKISFSAPHCNRTTVEGLKSTADAGSGDSGGPHFRIDGDYIYILGPHSKHNTANGNHYRSFMPAAYDIYDTFGWTFGVWGGTC